MDFGSFTLVAATADLSEEPAARGVADAVEFRMDMAADPVAALTAYDGDLPLVATNRPAWEGGDRPDGPDRLAELERAVEHDAVGAVDVELAALRGRAASELAPARVADLVDRARETGTAVIVSTHDFEGTPTRDRMRDLLAAAGDRGDVAKLAVSASDAADALAVLAVTHEATAAGETVATMAMGEAGRHTRAVAPVYGSKVGYAPVDPAEATAPGQYDLATLSELVERLRSG
ncbi:MAG: type I 3-dehydroquinate dehydratase [Haloarculaceae archaeon]